MADGQGLPSLELIADAAHEERKLQLDHLDALDTKAGVVVGFAGAIAALARDVTSGLGKAGVLCALAAGALAMLAYFPRRASVFDLLLIRNRYLRAEPEFSRLRLLDTEVEMARRAANLIEHKARWLKLSLLALVVGVAMLAGSTLANSEHRRSPERRRPRQRTACVTAASAVPARPGRDCAS